MLNEAKFIDDAGVERPLVRLRAIDGGEREPAAAVKRWRRVARRMETRMMFEPRYARMIVIGIAFTNLVIPMVGFGLVMAIAAIGSAGATIGPAMPIWMAVSGVGTYLAVMTGLPLVFWLVGRRMRKAQAPWIAHVVVNGGLCASCGYSLRGVANEEMCMCSECGARFRSERITAPYWEVDSPRVERLEQYGSAGLLVDDALGRPTAVWMTSIRAWRRIGVAARAAGVEDVLGRSRRMGFPRWIVRAWFFFGFLTIIAGSGIAFWWRVWWWTNIGHIPLLIAGVFTLGWMLSARMRRWVSPNPTVVARMCVEREVCPCCVRKLTKTVRGREDVWACGFCGAAWEKAERSNEQSAELQ